jgi:hypothetical protein
MLKRMQVERTLRAEPGNDLFALLLQAARDCSAPTQGAIGVLEIEWLSSGSGPVLAFGLEAEFAYRDGRRVVEGLDVRVRARTSSRSDVVTVLQRGLPSFGGCAFTNLCMSPPGADGMDVTISFPRMPFWSNRLLLFAGTTEPGELACYGAVLSALGVSHRILGSGPAARRHALVRPLAPEAQIEAYEAARGRGFDASLYASTLPVTQSFRVEESAALGDGVLDVVMSRGLSATRDCTSEDARQMSAFLAEHFHFQVGEREYRATNLIAEAKRPAEPIFKGHQRKARAFGALR